MPAVYQGSPPRYRAVSTNCTGIPIHWIDPGLWTPLVVLAKIMMAIFHDKLHCYLLPGWSFLVSSPQQGSRPDFCSVVIPLKVLFITIWPPLWRQKGLIPSRLCILTYTQNIPTLRTQKLSSARRTHWEHNTVCGPSPGPSLFRQISRQQGVTTYKTWTREPIGSHLHAGVVLPDSRERGKQVFGPCLNRRIARVNRRRPSPKKAVFYPQWRTGSKNIGCQETKGTHPQL
jgi:hypothetical protein